MPVSTPLTRAELVALIAAQGSVVFYGKIYSNAADLPTQAQIDAIYGNVSGSFSDTGIIAAETATKTAVEAVRDRLPAALDVDGGIKVHVQNGGTGGGAATIANGADVATGNTADADTALTVIGRLKKILSELQARLPAALGGNGGIKVDIVGGNPTSTSVSNFPATQAVSAAALPLPAGASTSANQTTQNTSLASIDGKLPTALSGGALKVDIVGNTAAIGGAAAPAPVTLQAAPANFGTLAVNEIISAAISGRGFKGIDINLYRANTPLGASGTVVLKFYVKQADGTYLATTDGFGAADISAPNLTAAGKVRLTIYPGLTEDTTNLGSARANQFLPDDFKIGIKNTTQVNQTLTCTYKLLP